MIEEEGMYRVWADDTYQLIEQWDEPLSFMSDDYLVITEAEAIARGIIEDPN